MEGVVSVWTDAEIPTGAADTGSTGLSELQPAETIGSTSKKVNRRIWTSQGERNRTMCASKMRPANVHLQHMHGLK